MNEFQRSENNSECGSNIIQRACISDVGGSKSVLGCSNMFKCLIAIPFHIIMFIYAASIQDKSIFCYKATMLNNC